MHVMFLSFSLTLFSFPISFSLASFFSLSFRQSMYTCAYIEMYVCVYVCTRTCVHSVACNTSFLSPFHCISVCITIACLLFTNSNVPSLSLLHRLSFFLFHQYSVYVARGVCARAHRYVPVDWSVIESFGWI